MAGWTLCLVCAALWTSSLHILGVSGASSSISAPRTLIFGPGAGEHTTPLPLNYFFIQARDKNGENITDCPRDAFMMELRSPQAGRVRHRTKIDYHGRGLFLVQYRMYGDYADISLSVTHNGKHVSSSPYFLGAVFHEDCACPLYYPGEWLSNFQCPEAEEQIVEDLKPFREGGGVNVTGLYERAGEMYARNSFVHYSIVGGKLYAQTFGSIVGFKFLSDMILLSLVNKVHLPDMELIVNLGDWPLNKKTLRKGGVGELLPTFSWCGSGDTWDIVWPTWDLMKSTIMGMDRVSFTILSALETQNIPWSDKDPRVFFRGRDSNKMRLELVKQHRKNTEMFDVGIVAWFFFKHEEDVYGPVANRVGFNEFFKYKYQISIDGTVAAYRFPYLLAGGSLVLKQDSDYYEHFYWKLLPWEHYVPVSGDIGDLVERVEWAREEDGKAEEMAANSGQFVKDHLLPDALYCYMVRLLQEYAALQVGTPQVHPGMEPVSPEVPHDCTHTCKQAQQVQQKKDEL